MVELLAAGENRIVLRLSRNIASAAQAQFGYEDGQMLHGAALDGPVVFQESGLRTTGDVTYMSWTAVPGFTFVRSRRLVS